MDEKRWKRPASGPRISEDSDGGPDVKMTEGEYLQELAHGMKPVEVHLRSGEIFNGVIEYYDRRFVRLTRKGEPNLFIFKQDIKYFCEK